MQDARRVGADLDARADLADGRGALVDVDVESGLQQRQRRRDAADATADDRDRGARSLLDAQVLAAAARTGKVVRSANFGHTWPMAAVRERLRDPVVWGNAFLLVKAVGAAVLAWVLARSVFGLAQPFLAPWAALLTVHATVYRTFTRGLQQVAAAVLGVLLAFAAGAAVRGQRGVAGDRAAGGHGRRDDARAARRVHHRRGDRARRPARPATAATRACSGRGCSTP